MMTDSERIKMLELELELLRLKNSIKKEKENKYIDYKQKCIEYLIYCNTGFYSRSWARAEYTYSTIRAHKKDDKDTYLYIISNY